MSTYLILYGKPRFLGAVQSIEELPSGAPVKVLTPRGLEIGTVAGPLSSAEEERFRNKKEPKGEEGLTDIQLLGYPTAQEMADDEERRQDEEEGLRLARALLTAHQLPIKLVDLEYVADRKKLFFYFTSENRVDFRAFVRDLAREFRTRIELRQIGARDEAKVLGGLGSCGMPCCCKTFLHSFAPINIRMVKEQNLSLNPTKISGLCGRLMCCLSYEQAVYAEVWKGLPQVGAKIRNDKGVYILLAVDVAHRTCQIRGPKGYFWLPVDRFAQFRDAVRDGLEWDNEEQGLDLLGQPLASGEASLSSQGRRCHGCTGGANCECEKRRAALRAQEEKEHKAPEKKTTDKKPPKKNPQKDKEPPRKTLSAHQGGESRSGGDGAKKSGPKPQKPKAPRPEGGSNEGAKKRRRRRPKGPRPQEGAE